MTQREVRDVWLSLLAVVASAATVVTCSALGPNSRTPTPQALQSSPSSVVSAPTLVSASNSAVAPLASAATEEPTQQPIAGPAPTSIEGNLLPQVPRFFAALAGLAAKTRDRPVRILWLGDSHTQADIWTQALRTNLQSKFGKGGLGFVHLGWTKHYSHKGASLHTDGKWRHIPSKLVSVQKVEDGVFGLGGIRLVPDGPNARASVTIDASQVVGKTRWDVAFRLPDTADALSITATGAQPLQASQRDADAGAPTEIRHLLVESPSPGGTLSVNITGGRPELLGVVIESSEPGVVVDTLGLNGARIATALAYDEATWVREVARRVPDLVIIAYGSNESSDGKVRQDRHAALLEQLVARIRAAAPTADCLVFGPIDRGGKSYEEAIEQLNAAQRQASAKVGCAFWSGQVAMGGKGTMIKWEAEEPPLAQADWLHLTSRGYERLGNMLARDLLQAYDARRP